MESTNKSKRKKCPTCGHFPSGRHAIIDHVLVLRLWNDGLSKNKISKKLGISRQAVQYIVKKNLGPLSEP